ncbi:L-lactate permease [Actinomycetospora sp. NBRC 106375]|uniref:L-lactate permease n=1 Tax=Actinomycetospora sp. NBRC 106375 TaxID=3032207 RepID=UPI0024A01375|nr:L-lactate permease [Actinomycetospora sp. NBRC 106375]GLZ44396.1 L-lactate permease [Actinomycetospora sp. NBRC 106375]
MYVQNDTPLGSLALSSLVAVLPLLVLFVLLGGLRVRAWLASLIGLAVALLVAILVYGMPVGQAVLAGIEGAAFGFFPILWIVINALWIYQMTVTSGHFDVLRRSFGSVSDDPRVQAVIIAFAFGALLEALAGFGTPVAICTIMLIALRFHPLKAAVVALVANTAPVAFGAIAVPITTLAQVTGLPEDALGAMVGRQTPILALFVPFVLVGLVDGWKGLRETWPVALVAGLVFGLAQFATSNYLSLPLTDIVAALLSAGAVVLLVRARPPRRAAVATDATAEETAATRTPVGVGGGDGTGGDGTGGDATGGVPAEGADADDHRQDSRRDTVLAYTPYVIIIVLFGIQQIPPVSKALKAVTVKFNWPGLDVRTAAGKPVSTVAFNLNWLEAAGTILLIAGVITALVLRLRPGSAVAAYGRTLVQLRTAIPTVMAVLALAYVMNDSGQTLTLGALLAGTGGFFAVLSPVLGWLGTAVTGSDTSSNSLFGALQVTAAKGAGLDPILLAAANSSGGVLGKMISPQNLAIAASAVGMAGREGEILRRVLLWSLVFLAGMCVLVLLQSTPVLGWMVVAG